MRFPLECRQENFYVEQKTTNYDVVRLSQLEWKEVEIENPMLRALESFFFSPNNISKPSGVFIERNCWTFAWHWIEIWSERTSSSPYKRVYVMCLHERDVQSGNTHDSFVEIKKSRKKIVCMTRSMRVASSCWLFLHSSKQRASNIESRENV